ncbi:hypothetical protein PR202_ga21580 [Eleusine coracana subsp. coracana]|uniref:Ubiquitinyl hydrolase 1 n=1 Tax=Eleusine coracana subsp. coracana TaxID=191504 RepID=A0AAV5D0Z8_ELECO|nr:hypothetical protein PR202_ga21580 [Eleusine coracana subsp. coracana]
MEETREGAGEKQERAEEPPRKAPRLDLLVAAAAATDSGRGEAVAPPEVSNLREEGAEGTSDNKQCNHVPTDSAHLKMLSSSVFSEHAGSGVGSVEYPFGHSRGHAREEEHWVAALSENPKSAFCFKCDCVTDGPHVITGLLAAAEGDSGSSEQAWPEPKDSCGNEPCNHIPTDNAHKEMLRSALVSEHAGECMHCKTFSNILVCMECGLHFCAGLEIDCPLGHARLHAKQKQHWVAALYDNPKSAYCFKCECVTDLPDDEERDGFEAGDDAVKLNDEARNLIQGLSNAFRLAYVHDYAIRGIPNQGLTCYMNAVVQCFLVLDKLRERMLGPDAPKGLFAAALTDLFVGATAAESLLDPYRLLTCVRWYKQGFEGFKMYDSHELLMSLLNGLKADELKNRNEQNGAPTCIEFIFECIMFETLTCKCSFSSDSHTNFLNLSLPLPSRCHPPESTAPQRTSENINYQLKKVVHELFPVNDPSKTEKVHTIAESGDSHLPCSELKDVVVEETPGPLEVGKIKFYMLGSADSTEVQRICQSKDAVQGHLQTQEDKVTCPEPKHSQRITEVPVQSASLLPLSMSVKVEEMNKTTADSVASIEDCLSLFHGEVVNWHCANCSKVYMELNTDQSEMDEQIATSAKDTTTIDGDQAEQSDRLKCKNGQSSGSNSLSVESKFLSSRQLHGSDAEDQNMQTKNRVTGGTNLGQRGEDVSIQKIYQERKKQTEPDRSAYQLEDNINEQKDENVYATQTRCFIKLPAVLNLHLKRTSAGGVKISDHVRYKEYLDVEPFTDPRY